VGIGNGDGWYGWKIDECAIFSRQEVGVLKTIVIAGLMALLFTPALAEVRIKDVVTFEGIRENQLIGYGLVVGLNGTGDSLKNSPFTRKSIEGMLVRLGVGNLSEESIKTQNAAAVMVTANLTPYARRGSPIDIVVSSLGDASSLKGGTLLVTPLAGADGQVYAVAQGPISVAGFSVQANAASLVEGVPTRSDHRFAGGEGDQC
jgi:flagellar P-ring protein precursor FlgI